MSKIGLLQPAQGSPTPTDGSARPVRGNWVYQNVEYWFAVEWNYVKVKESMQIFVSYFKFRNVT